MSPRLLDLFCGAGGASVGYHRAGFEVVGVDIEPQPNYPFEFRQHDALKVFAGHVGGRHHAFGMFFDAIHASPPCQAFTTLRVMPNAGAHLDLVAATRDRILATGLPYVMENVEGAPLLNPVRLCGAAFGLGTATHDLARHRLFECSFPVMALPCAHGSRPVIGFFGDHVRDSRRVPGSTKRLPDLASGREDKLRLGAEAMGIDWMEWAELTQAIPPAMTEHVGQYLIAEINRAVAA